MDVIFNALLVWMGFLVILCIYFMGRILAYFHSSRRPYLPAMTGLVFLILLTAHVTWIVYSHQDGSPFTWDEYPFLAMFVPLSVLYLFYLGKTGRDEMYFQIVYNHIQRKYPHEHRHILEHRVEEMLEDPKFDVEAFADSLMND